MRSTNFYRTNRFDAKSYDAKSYDANIYYADIYDTNWQLNRRAEYQTVFRLSAVHRFY